MTIHKQAATKDLRPVTKSIRVTCQGADLVDLEQLYTLQGSLKSLSDGNYKKLRQVIIEEGISFPFFVWKQRGKLWTLDGHQRDRTLNMMAMEGWRIPKVPVDYIEAHDVKHAKKKILLISSQYGHMTETSLAEFADAADLDLRELNSSMDFPAVDLESILREMKDDDIGAAAPDPEDPDSGVVVQIKEKKRDHKGNLVFKRYRTISFYNVTLEYVYDRIVKALKDKSS